MRSPHLGCTPHPRHMPLRMGSVSRPVPDPSGHYCRIVLLRFQRFSWPAGSPRSVAFFSKVDAISEAKRGRLNGETNILKAKEAVLESLLETQSSLLPVCPLWLRSGTVGPMRLCSYLTWGTRPSSPPSRRLPSCRDLSEAPASPHPCGPELEPGVSSCSPHCPAVQRLCQGAHKGLSCLGLGITGARNLVQDEAVGTWEETVNSSAWLLPQGVCLSAHVYPVGVCVDVGMYPCACPSLPKLGTLLHPCGFLCVQAL